MRRRSRGTRPGAARGRPGAARGRPPGGRPAGRRPQPPRRAGRNRSRRTAAAGRGAPPAGKKQAPPPPSAADLLAGARDLFTKKRYGEALGAFDAALSAIEGGDRGGAPARSARREADRCREEVDRNRAQLEQITGRMQSAASAAADGTAAAASAAADALALRAAACRFRLGRYGEALGALEAGGGGASGHAADELAGDCLSALGRHAEAEDAYLHALDDAGITARKCVQIGDMLAGNGRHAGAESAYARASEKGADVHRKLDNCRARIGRTDFAPGGPPRDDRTRMAIAAGRIMDRAMRLDKEGRYDDAVPLYVEAFRANPGMPDGFAGRMEGLAAASSSAGRGGAAAAAEAPHDAAHIPDGSAVVVDSNVCLRAMIMLALGRPRSRSVPRGWSELSGVASSLEKNVRSGAYVLTFKVYHETRSLLYSTRGIGDLLLDHSSEVEVCMAAAGKLDRLWAAHGVKARPNAGLVDEAKRAMWAGWMAADSGTKALWRSRKEVPERPYEGGCSGEWADASILASAIMIMRGNGLRRDGEGGRAAPRPRTVCLLTKDSDFTMFADGITAESKVRIVGEFA